MQAADTYGVVQQGSNKSLLQPVQSLNAHGLWEAETSRWRAMSPDFYGPEPC